MQDKNTYIMHNDPPEPLTWNDKALIFEDEEEAQKVLDYLKVTDPSFVGTDAYVKTCILFYESGYIHFRDIIWDR